MAKKKYDVEICRTSYGFNTIEVEAEDHMDAERVADEIAGDHLYNEKESEYTINSVTLKEEG